VLFAYFQAGLFVKYIVETFGWETVLDMLRAYAREADTDAVMLETTSMTMSELNDAFEKWIEVTFVNRIKIHPDSTRARNRSLARKVKKSPDDTALLARAAWSCFRLGKDVDARRHLGRLLEIDPQNVEGLFLSGEIAFSSGRTEQAEDYYRRGLEKGGEDFHVFNHLGIICRDKGEIDESVVFFEKALDCFPGFTGPETPYLHLVSVNMMKGDPEQALEWLWRYTRLSEQDFESRLSLAGHYRREGRLSRAALLFREAIEIDPFIRSLHLELGKILHDLGKSDEALEALDVALLVRPVLENDPKEEGTAAEDYDSLADVHAARAAILADLGRIDEAREAAEKALSCKPDHGAAKSLLEKLR